MPRQGNAALEDGAKKDNSSEPKRNGVERKNDDGAEEFDSAPKKRSYAQRIPARVVLGIVSFFGFFTNYMLRVSINIAIVAMVKPDNKSDAVDFRNFTSGNKDGTCIGVSQYFLNDTKDAFGDSDQTILTEGEEAFTWNSIDQGIVLGAFYWSYVVSLVPGALLARQFGAKIVFGAANGLTALLALVTPFAARTSFIFLIVVRVLQGFASGTTWPAMHTMASRWIPPHERSKFISTYLGNAVGIAVTYPLCGVLIDHYGWSAAFYAPGVIGLLWCISWWLLVFDSPSTHPRITNEEKMYIEKAVSVSLSSKKVAIPWLKIVKSTPVWALVIANLGSLWGFMTVLTYGPTYFKRIHGFNIQANGVLSGLPNIMRFFGGVMISYITDQLLKKKVFSFTIIRKMATLIAELIPGLLYLLMTNVGCNPSAEVAILTVAAGLSGATSAGPLANMMDLAPNFAGMLMSLISLISMSTGFIVPSIVGAIINQNDSIERWRIVFVIGAVVSIICSLVYAFFGSAEVQPWNEETNGGKEEYESECSQVLSNEENETTKNGVDSTNRKYKKKDDSNEIEASEKLTE